MQKWEYLYVVAYEDNVQRINDEKPVRDTSKLPNFLQEVGQDGWELVGLTPYSDGASRCRLIFKRPLS